MFKTIFFISLLYLFFPTSDKFKIKQNLKDAFLSANIVNPVTKKKIKILSVNITEYGYLSNIDIANVVSLDDLINKKNYLKQALKARFIFFEDNYSYITLYAVLNETSINYKPVLLPNYKLLFGYDFKNEPLIADMKICPHVLISGLSGQGKTGLLKIIIKNLQNCDILLLNGFKEDFPTFKNIIGKENILLELETLIQNLSYRSRPLYVVIDELATLKEKKFDEIIKELLCVGRHYNIFLVGVIQIATKEEIKYKSYFNTRITFKQNDSSAYQVILGTTVKSNLKQRQFFLLSDSLYLGNTYNF